MVIDLLPCPFCGGNVKTEHDNWHQRTTIRCADCQVTFDMNGSTDSLIARWQRRDGPMASRSADWKEMAARAYNAMHFWGPESKIFQQAMRDIAEAYQKENSEL
jgi:Lar family restriction alleviation protein